MCQSKQADYSQKIQKQLDGVGATIEHWTYRTLPAVRFIGLELFYDGDAWETVREKVAGALDAVPQYASGFDYDLTLTHHFGKRVEEERNHDFIGRFMKADTPVPDGFVHWDFVPDDTNTPYLTFCSQFAFSVFAGNHDALHRHEGFDVHALYDVTRNIILGENVTSRGKSVAADYSPLKRNKRGHMRRDTFKPHNSKQVLPNAEEPAWEPVVIASFLSDDKSQLLPLEK